MIHYKTFQWLFFFYMYCFLGWCFESTYVSVKSKKWVNRGFMRGPFLPLYGSGATMMLVVSMPFQENVLLTYIAGVVGATALEYITGVTMEALFNVRYWDYSGQPFNFQGHICLKSSLAWGFLTILMTRVIHRPIEQFILSIPGNALFYLTALLTIYIVADFTLSFKAALDLRDILIKMQRIREEMERMQRRLDGIIAFSNEEKEQKKQERELIDRVDSHFTIRKQKGNIREILKLLSVMPEILRAEYTQITLGPYLLDTGKLPNLFLEIVFPAVLHQHGNIRDIRRIEIMLNTACHSYNVVHRRRCKH